MVMSGALIATISFNAYALNQTEMEKNYQAENGGTTTDVHAKFQAFEAQLKAEMAAGKAVKLNSLGTFEPKQLSGKTHTSYMGGKAYTTPTYELVKNPTAETQTEFQAKMAAAAKMTDEEAAKITTYYQSTVIKTLNKGGAMAQVGLGTYKTAYHKPTTSCTKKGICTFHPGQMTATFNGGKATHARLVTDPALTAQLSN
jgi:nucleoid DNA-binding protein